MLHHADIHPDQDHLRLRLRGLAALGALRRRVDVPYAQIREVTTDPLPSRPTVWRLGGLAAGGARYGTFRQDGRWLFLAHRDPARVVRLRLDGDGPERVRFAEVVIGTPDPEDLAATLRARITAA
jgi:hypothetical protein